MHPSTVFNADPIPQTLAALDSGYQGVGWKGGLVNIDDEWRTTTDKGVGEVDVLFSYCLLYTSPSPRDRQKSRMPSSA